MDLVIVLIYQCLADYSACAMQAGSVLSDHDFHNITLASPTTDYKDERMNE